MRKIYTITKPDWVKRTNTSQPGAVQGAASSGSLVPTATPPPPPGISVPANLRASRSVITDASSSGGTVAPQPSGTNPVAATRVLITNPAHYATSESVSASLEQPGRRSPPSSAGVDHNDVWYHAELVEAVLTPTPSRTPSPAPSDSSDTSVSSSLQSFEALEASCVSTPSEFADGPTPPTPTPSPVPQQPPASRPKSPVVATTGLQLVTPAVTPASSRASTPAQSPTLPTFSPTPSSVASSAPPGGTPSPALSEGPSPRPSPRLIDTPPFTPAASQIPSDSGLTAFTPTSSRSPSPTPSLLSDYESELVNLRGAGSVADQPNRQACRELYTLANLSYVLEGLDRGVNDRIFWFDNVTNEGVITHSAGAAALHDPADGIVTCFFPSLHDAQAYIDANIISQRSRRSDLLSPTARAQFGIITSPNFGPITALVLRIDGDSSEVLDYTLRPGTLVPITGNETRAESAIRAAMLATFGDDSDDESDASDTDDSDSFSSSPGSSIEGLSPAWMGATAGADSSASDRNRGLYESIYRPLNAVCNVTGTGPDDGRSITIFEADDQRGSIEVDPSASASGSSAFAHPPSSNSLYLFFESAEELDDFLQTSNSAGYTTRYQYLSRGALNQHFTPQSRAVLTMQFNEDGVYQSHSSVAGNLTAGAGNRVRAEVIIESALAEAFRADRADNSAGSAGKSEPEPEPELESTLPWFQTAPPSTPPPPPPADTARLGQYQSLYNAGSATQMLHNTEGRAPFNIIWFENGDRQGLLESNAATQSIREPEVQIHTIFFRSRAEANRYCYHRRHGPEPTNLTSYTSPNLLEQDTIIVNPAEGQTVTALVMTFSPSGEIVNKVIQTGILTRSPDSTFVQTAITRAMQREFPTVPLATRPGYLR